MHPLLLRHSLPRTSGGGGVYGLYFDKDGNIVDYKTLLSNTKRNCGGGLSPWHSWISCEEVSPTTGFFLR